MSSLIKKSGIISVIIAMSVIVEFATVQIASAVSTFAAASWTTAAQDLTIEAGATTAKSLILISDESAEDAINIDATAGGIDIDAVGTAGEDISIINTGASVVLSASEDVTDAINIDATVGGIDIDAVGGITMDSSTTTITATGNSPDTIYLHSNGGTADTIRIHADQGTAVAEAAGSITLLSDAGGVSIRSAANLANAIHITSDGGTTGTILIYNDQGSSVTEAAASVEILSDAGGVELRSTANLANAIALTSDGGTTGSILIFNDQGTGVSSIELLSDVGGISLTSATTTVTTTADSPDAIYLHANGGTAERIRIRADQGTSATSIELASTAGGVTITGGTAILIGDATIGLTYFEDTEAVTADNTLTVAESGNTFYLSGAAATTTLPATASSNGVVFRFVVAASVTGNIVVTTPSNADTIEGALIVAGAVVDCDAEDAIIVVADGENLGDYFELRSNGTKWFIGSSGALTTAKLLCQTQA